jgi:predicted transposase/invertase (TIGR01784 family)
MYLMGIEQGIEQGRDRERKTIALNMLRKNISLETIAELTGLNVDRLQQLQATLSNDR